MGGIVHRDLKLQNWLFPSPDAPDDSIKLIDFGFSKLIENSRQNLNAVTAGTVEYLAPELLSHTSRVSFPGDMWALGVIVFMMLGGYPPFSGKNNTEIVNAIRNYGKIGKDADRKPGDGIKWFKSRWDKVSEEAKSLVLGLLNPDPDKRFTALQALDHPWIARALGADEEDSSESKNLCSNGTLSTDILKALKNFSQRTAFEKATAMIMVQCLSQAETAKLEKVFLQLDQTHEGSVRLWELKAALEQNSEGINDTEIAHIHAELDYNHDQYVYFSDFVTAVVAGKVRDKNDTLLRATFDRFDTDNSGFISLENLKNLFGSSFRGISVEDLLAEADLKKDGMIDYDEFTHFLLWREHPGPTGEISTISPGPGSPINRMRKAYQPMSEEEL